MMGDDHGILRIFKENPGSTIPEGWRLSSIGDEFALQQGKALSPKERRGVSPFPFLRTKDVLWGIINTAKLDNMDFTEEEIGKHQLRPGDVLVCEGGDVGRTAMWEHSGLRCCYQNHLHRLRALTGGVDPEFFTFWMRAGLTQFGLYAGSSNETTIKNLSGSRLKEFVFPLPPLPEQRAIAHVLSTIQMAIAAQDRIIELTRELKKALMVHLFTYGPVPLDEVHRVKLKETEFGRIRSDWNVVPLSEAVDHIDYGYSISIPASEDPDGVPIISTADISKQGKLLYEKIRRIKAPERVVANLQLQNGDVLFNWRNSPELVGKTTVFTTQADSMIFASFILRIACDEGRSHNYFLSYVLNYMREKGTFMVLARRAVNQANYNRNEISVLPIPLPPHEHQVAIADILRLIDWRVDQFEHRKDLLQQTFGRVLSDLMTGQIRTTGGLLQ